MQEAILAFLMYIHSTGCCVSFLCFEKKKGQWIWYLSVIVKWLSVILWELNKTWSKKGQYFVVWLYFSSRFFYLKTARALGYHTLNCMLAYSRVLLFRWLLLNLLLLWSCLFSLSKFCVLEPCHWNVLFD